MASRTPVDERPATTSDLPPTPASAPAAHDGLTRRTFLHRAGLVGGTALVVSAGGVSYRAYDNGVFETGSGGAYDAWRTWEQGRGPLALVSAAILAANPHDTQAWVFATSPTRIDVFADRSRSLGSIDPFEREMYTGLGCALENLLQAAPAHGYRATATLLPTAGQPVHAARIDLKPGPQRRAALYEAIPMRRTDRSAYASTAVPQRAMAQMSALAGGLPGARLHWFAGEVERARVGGLMISAAHAVTTDEQQSRDGFAWYRSSADAIQKHKDGLTLDAQGLSRFTTAVAKMLPASSRATGDKFWLEQTRKTQTRTAAAYGIVTVDDASDDAQRLTGGRLLERVHLWATANGIALQHMNQITERIDRERQLKRPARFAGEVDALLPDGGGQPLVAFRIGYAKGTDGRRESPRRPTTSVVR